MASAIPRVRTYHTKKPSRFVHALPARPLKVHGGRGSSLCADGMESIFFILSIGCTWVLRVGGGALDDPKNAKRYFFLPHGKVRQREQRLFILTDRAYRNIHISICLTAINPAGRNPLSDLRADIPLFPYRSRPCCGISREISLSHTYLSISDLCRLFARHRK